MPRDNIYMYLAHVCFYVCCMDCVGVCEYVCWIAAAVKDSVFLTLECWTMLYVCERGVMDVVFSICIVTRVWEVWMFRHAEVVCLCLMCILWQYSILHDLQFVNAVRGCKWRPYGRGILQSQSQDYLICSHECLLLFTLSCCCDCFYHL